MPEDDVKLEPKYVPRRYLSISTLISWARCRRKYFYEKSGIRAPGLMLAPNYGSAMHEAIPIALTTEDEDQAYDAFLISWEETEELIQLAGIDAKKHNRECARRSIKHFIHTHKGHKSIYKLTPPPAGALPLDNKTSEYEVPWAMDIGLRIPLVGRIDSMCEHRDTKEPFVWELKTTSSPLGARFFDAHEMFIQNLTYILVGQTMSIPVSGVMLEGLHVNDKKVDNQVQIIPTTPHHLEDVLVWLQQTGQALLDSEDAYEELGDKAFPKDFTGCTPYTHYYMPGWRCDFADLCRVPDWRALTDLYHIVPDHDFLQDVTVEGNAIHKPK